MVGEQDRFEQIYTSQLKGLLAAHGQFVGYDSDRAALDLGLHLSSGFGPRRTAARKTKSFDPLTGRDVLSAGGFVDPDVFLIAPGVFEFERFGKFPR